MDNMFEGVTLSTAHYDDMLNKWSSLSLTEGVNFHGGGSQYSPVGKDARDKLINLFLWSVDDGGEV